MTGLDAVAFLAGRWLSESGAHILEEVWPPAVASSMLGVFRWLADGRHEFADARATPRAL